MHIVDLAPLSFGLQQEPVNSLLAIETALLTRRQQNAEHKACHVGMAMNME